MIFFNLVILPWICEDANCSTPIIKIRNLIFKVPWSVTAGQDNKTGQVNFTGKDYYKTHALGVRTENFCPLQNSLLTLFGSIRNRFHYLNNHENHRWKITLRGRNLLFGWPWIWNRNQVMFYCAFLGNLVVFLKYLDAELTLKKPKISIMKLLRSAPSFRLWTSIFLFYFSI